MFNLFPKKKSVDEILESNENLYNSIKKEASDLATGVVNGVYEIIALKNELQHQLNENVKLKEENKNLEDVLKSIEEDGTAENNNAIELRQENAKLKVEIDKWENDWDEQNKNVSELMKEVKGLRHLKKENVELMERVNEIDSDMNKEYQDEIFTLKNEIAVLKNRNTELLEKYNGIITMGGLKYMEARLQIVQNDYKKCAEQRDEYKHQLNAANKEIEALKSKLRDYQDKYAESFSYNDMNKLQKEIDDLKLMYTERDTKLKTYNGTLLGQISGLKEENEKLNLQVTALHKIIEGGKETIDRQKAEIKKLQDDIVEYVFEKDNKIEEKETEKYYVCNRCGYKVDHDTNYYGGCGFCKEGLMIEKEEKQKHPMYPLHWGGIDPDIYEQAKNHSIEEIVDNLKGIKTQGFEDYDMRDFVESEIKNEDPLEGEQIEKDKEFSSEELLKRATEFADSITGTKAFPKDLFDKAKGLVEGVDVDLENPLDNLPKSFPNEFQEETTAENLEEKFDRGENVLDYFCVEPYHCPCNMCKHAREESAKKYQQETASDLDLIKAIDLRITKLEEKNSLQEAIIKATRGELERAREINTDLSKKLNDFNIQRKPIRL